MGLAASQARLISLQARMSDLEYEGQQINQQRQTLTNKMTEVYNKAMDMPVPTPPSKIDFAQEAYSGKIGNHKVEIKQDDSGKWYGYEVRSAQTASNTAANVTKTTYNVSQTINVDSDEFKRLVAAGILEALEPTQTGDEIIYSAPAGAKYEVEDGVATILEQFTVPYVAVSHDGMTDNYIPTSYESANDGIKNSENFKNGYEGLKNVLETTLHDKNQSFDDKKVSFIQVGDGFKFLYDFDAEKSTTAVYTSKNDENAHVAIENLRVSFDPGTQNINGFTYDIGDEKDIFVNVTANGAAYNEIEYDAAVRQYELDKIAYDKQQNEFNKQTSVYQRQDKQLELKLTRLDNERNALNTEIESVKKVIQDATEGGFKTFSG